MALKAALPRLPPLLLLQAWQQDDARCARTDIEAAAAKKKTKKKICRRCHLKIEGQKNERAAAAATMATITTTMIASNATTPPPPYHYLAAPPRDGFQCLSFDHSSQRINFPRARGIEAEQ